MKPAADAVVEPIAAQGRHALFLTAPAFAILGEPVTLAAFDRQLWQASTAVGLAAWPEDLALFLSPTLVVADATRVMMTNGPTGGSLSDLKQTNTMIVSTDPVAADAYGATLLDRTLEELAFIKKAEAEGAGTADYMSLNPKILTSG